MENKIVIQGFKLKIEHLNSKLKEENEKNYDLCKLAIYLSKMSEGFIVDKLGKTTKTGTCVTYKRCENEEEEESYIQMIDKMVDDIKEKHSIGNINV